MSRQLTEAAVWANRKGNLLGVRKRRRRSSAFGIPTIVGEAVGATPAPS